MILKKLEELEGNEILAREIMSEDFQVILPEGSQIRKEYINKLKRLEIAEVYVKEPEATEEISILKSEIKKSVKETVKDVLERHTYQRNDELSHLNDAADEIITNILEEDKVVEKIFDIKERSADIYEHSVSICSLAILTALKMDVEISNIHDIGVACLLHDVGLRYLTIEYNNQNIASLNQQELIEYKKHPIYGFSSLKDEEWISKSGKNIILTHHERLDGSGYPLRLKKIPIESMIVIVCDAFDEMICGIGCERVKVYEAVEYMKSYKGILFDSDVVDTFLDFTAVYPAGTKVITNEGEEAIVLSQNKGFQDRPIIRIVKDKNGKPVEGNVIKDLIQIHSLFIEKVID